MHGDCTVLASTEQWADVVEASDRKKHHMSAGFVEKRAQDAVFVKIELIHALAGASHGAQI